MAANFEISSPKAGEFSWVLKSQGRTLAIGESYARKLSAEKAIEALRKAAAAATVADLTLKPAKTPPAAASRAAKPAKATQKTTARKATAAKKAATPRKRKPSAG